MDEMYHFAIFVLNLGQSCYMFYFKNFNASQLLDVNYFEDHNVCLKRIFRILTLHMPYISGF